VDRASLENANFYLTNCLAPQLSLIQSIVTQTVHVPHQISKVNHGLNCCRNIVECELVVADTNSDASNIVEQSNKPSWISYERGSHAVSRLGPVFRIRLAYEDVHIVVVGWSIFFNCFCRT
jgi:hypothetical protein